MQISNLSKRILALLAAGLGALAAWPLLEPRLTLTFDSVFHYYALIQLDHLFQEGVWYTRWFPYSMSGLGSPFYQYYPPLAHYIAQAFNLFGLDTLAAMRAAWAAMLVAGSAGTYLWVEDRSGRGTGLVAAAAYSCGPYMLFNAYFRGGFAEQSALMLMPFVLWALARLARTGQGRFIVLGAAAYGGIIISHGLTAALFSPILLIYTLILGLGHTRGQERRRAIARMGIALALGLGIATFFWLPFLAERNAFHSELAYSSSGLDYRRHFITYQQLLARPFTTSLRVSVSGSAVGLALLGLLTASWRGLTAGDDSDISPSFIRDTVLVWFSALVTAICLFMQLPTSSVIWEAIPLLRYLQFPHRFLTVGTPFLSFLAAAGVQGLMRPVETFKIPVRLTIMDELLPRLRLAAQVVLLAAPVILLSSHAWRLPQKANYYQPLPEIDIEFVMEKTRETASAGGDLPTMFLPATVDEIPPITLMTQDGPERLDRDSLPAGATVLESTYTPLSYALTISSLESFTAHFLTFCFPGWRATLDDRPVDITPTSPYGLITVDVPSGEHDLRIWFGSTPIRVVSNAVSLLSLTLIPIVVVLQRRRVDK